MADHPAKLRAGLALLLLCASAQAYFSVAPQIVTLDLPAGGRRKLDFTIINGDDKEYTLRYFSTPFRQGEYGGYRIVGQPDSAYSCDGWFRTETTQVQMPAHSAKVITIEIVVPTNATGTHYGAMAFDKLPGKERTGSASVGIVMRTPAYVEIACNRPRYRPSAVLKAVELVQAREVQQHLGTKVRGDALAIATSVENDGQLIISTGGNIVLRNDKGRRIRQYPLGRGKIMPGATVKSLSVIPPLPPGQYTAEVSVNYGSPAQLRGSVPVTIGKDGPRTGALSTARTMAVTTNPELVELEAMPGTQRSAYIVVRNEGTGPLEFHSYCSGLRNDPEGTLVPADSVPARCDGRSLIALEPAEFRLEPGANQPVRLTATIPDMKPGGRYSSVVFEETRQVKGPSASISVPVLISVRGQCERSAEIVAINTKNPADNTAVVVCNNGQTHLKPQARVTVRRARPDNTPPGVEMPELGTYKLASDAVVLPGDTAMLTGRYEGELKPGKYQLDVNVDFGNGYKLRKSQPVVVN